MKQISNKETGKKDKRPAAGGLKSLLGRVPPEKREKLLVRVLVIAALIAMAGYAIVTALPEKAPGDTDVPPAYQEDGTDADNGPAGTGDTAQSGSGSQSPFDRTDMISSEGEVKDGFDAETSAYWCITPAFQGGGKTASHKIQVPLGWSAQAVRGGIRLKPEDFKEDAEGAEAMLFLWSIPDHFNDISEDGSYARSDAAVSETWYVEDWYLSDDGYGGEWPVYVIRHDAAYSGEDELLSGGYAEWYVLLAKPSENGLYFMATMTDDAFRLMSSPRVNTVPALARELFPPSSEPERPEAWTGAPEIPTEAPSEGEDGAGTPDTTKNGAEDGTETGTDPGTETDTDTGE